MDHPRCAAVSAASAKAAASARTEYATRLGGDPETRLARGGGVRVARAVRGGTGHTGCSEVIILVAVGEPSTGQPILEQAAELAVASEAAVVVLHVRERHYTRGVVWDEPAPADAAELLNDATYDLRRRNIAGGGAVARPPAGRVAEAIVRAAMDFGADLIVIGRSSERALTRFIAATISQRVVRLAPMPVFAVPRARPIRVRVRQPL